MRIELESGGGRLDVLYDGRARGHHTAWMPCGNTDPGAEPHGTPGGGWVRPLTVPVGGGELLPYTGSQELHARLGGATYYRSRSGLSHAGWVPAQPGVARVGTYRCDTFRPDLGRLDPPEVYGRRLLVPYSWDASRVLLPGAVETQWPVIDCTGLGPHATGWRGYGHGVEPAGGSRAPWAAGLLRGDVAPEPTRLRPAPEQSYGGQTVGLLRFLADNGEVNRLLLGEELPYEPHELSWTVHQPDHEGYPDRLEYTVVVHVTAAAWSGYARRLAVRRVVEELLWPLLAFTGEDSGTPAHWVGMRRCGGWAYRIRGGRAVGYQPVAEITDPDPGADEGVPGSAAAETLTNMLPAGFVALAPDVVVGHCQVLGPDRVVDISPATELRLVQRRGVDHARELLASAAGPDRRHPGTDQHLPTSSPADEPVAEWERELLDHPVQP